jgi:hypothetical protein
MDRADAVDGAEGGADALDVDIGRRGLHQDFERLLDQAPGRAEHQGRDQEADYRVDDRRAAGEDEGAGDEHPERAKRVGGAVTEHSLEVDVLALAAGEDEGGGEVAGEADRAQRQHPGAIDRGRIPQAPDRGDRDAKPDGAPQQPIDQRRQHLRALVAEGPPAARRPRGEAGGDQRQ